VTHQGAAWDAASIYFGPSIRKTDILVILGLLGNGVHVGDVKSQWDDTRDP